MKIYKVRYELTVKPTPGERYIDTDSINVSAVDAERATEKVKKKLLSARPLIETIEGKRITSKNEKIVINKVELLAEAEF